MISGANAQVQLLEALIFFAMGVGFSLVWIATKQIPLLIAIRWIVDLIFISGFAVSTFFIGETQCQYGFQFHQLVSQFLGFLLMYEGLGKFFPKLKVAKIYKLKKRKEKPSHIHKMHKEKETNIHKSRKEKTILKNNKSTKSTQTTQSPQQNFQTTYEIVDMRKSKKQP